jgi:NAD-dependent SIR2 family protein deacetylase
MNGPRQRYWARSLIGWRVMSAARPGPAHQALARLEAAGRVELLLTQNVDGLRRRRQPASSTCTGASTPWCAWPATRLPRTDWQALLHAQSRLASSPGRHRPRRRCRPGRPGLLHLPGARLPRCGTGMLKPDVVFWRKRAARTRRRRHGRAAARRRLLVAGSSLMVYSGYRFAQAFAAAGKPIAAINLGRTRADDMLALKVTQPVGEVLPSMARLLAAQG